MWGAPSPSPQDYWVPRIKQWQLEAGVLSPLPTVSLPRHPVQQKALDQRELGLKPSLLSGPGPSPFPSLGPWFHLCNVVMTSPPSELFSGVTLSKSPPSFLGMLASSLCALSWVEAFSPRFGDPNLDFWIKLPSTGCSSKASGAVQTQGPCPAEHWSEGWAPSRGHQGQYQEDRESQSNSSN